MTPARSIEWLHYPAYPLTATHVLGIFVLALVGQLLLNTKCSIVTNTLFKKLIQTKHDASVLMCHLSGSQ